MQQQSPRSNHGPSSRSANSPRDQHSSRTIDQAVQKTRLPTKPDLRPSRAGNREKQQHETKGLVPLKPDKFQELAVQEQSAFQALMIQQHAKPAQKSHQEKAQTAVSRQRPKTFQQLDGRLQSITPDQQKQSPRNALMQRETATLSPTVMDQDAKQSSMTPTKRPQVPILGTHNIRQRLVTPDALPASQVPQKSVLYHTFVEPVTSQNETNMTKQVDLNQQDSQGQQQLYKKFINLPDDHQVSTKDKLNKNKVPRNQIFRGKPSPRDKSSESNSSVSPRDKPRAAERSAILPGGVINFQQGKKSSAKKQITTKLDKIPDEVEEEPSLEDSHRPLLLNHEISADNMDGPLNLQVTNTLPQRNQIFYDSKDGALNEPYFGFPSQEAVFAQPRFMRQNENQITKQFSRYSSVEEMPEQYNNQVQYAPMLQAAEMENFSAKKSHSNATLNINRSDESPNAITARVGSPTKANQLNQLITGDEDQNKIDHKLKLLSKHVSFHNRTKALDVKKHPNAVKGSSTLEPSDIQRLSGFLSVSEGNATGDIQESSKSTGLVPKGPRIVYPNKSDSNQNPVRWKPISQVNQLGDIEKREQSMQNKITKLKEENGAYYRGKELRYDNLAHFYQCIVDPNNEDGFIAVQKRRKIIVKKADVPASVIDDHEEKIEDREQDDYVSVISSESSDNSQHVQQQEPEDELPEMATMKYFKLSDEVTKTQLGNNLVEAEHRDQLTLTKMGDINKKQEPEHVLDNETTFISFWRRNDGISLGQQECQEMFVEKGVIQRTIERQAPENDSYIGCQCLFTGLNKKVFFFSAPSNEVSILQEIVINIFNRGAEDENRRSQNGSAYQTSFSKKPMTKPEPELKKTTTTRLIIGNNSELFKALTSQLLKTSDTGFNLPEPTLITVNAIDYLVLAVLDDQSLTPSLCFFKVEAVQRYNSLTAKKNNIDEMQEMSGKEALRIKGAELLVSMNEETNKICYMTNGLLKAKKTNNVNFARLDSPSYVFETSIEDLLQNKKTDKHIQTLHSDPESMIFFRTESHRFPYVNTTSTHNKKDHSLTLLFYGRSDWPSIAIHFRLVDELAELVQGQLTGYYTTREELLQVNIQLQMGKQDKDCSGYVLSTDQKKEKEFKVHQLVTSLKWVPAKVSKLQLPESAPGLTINDLEFTENNEIIGGIVCMDTEIYWLRPQKLELTTHHDKTYQQGFDGEKRFKLDLIPDSLFQDDKEAQAVATIEGSYLNQPCNVILLGQLSKVGSQEKHIFAIQKQVLALLTLEGKHEFNCSIQGGTITGLENFIELRQSQEPRLIFDHVHRVVAQEDTETFLLHGNLSHLQYKTMNGGGGGRKDDSNFDQVLQLTQISPSKSLVEKNVKRKDMQLGSQMSLQQIWNQQGSTKHLIQGLRVTKSPLSITYAALVHDRHGFVSDTLKFIVNEEPKTANGPGVTKQKENSTLVTGLTEMKEAVDYPLLVYNSYLPDNSELVVTNMAEKIKTSQVIDIGENLSFVTFVNGPFLANEFNKTETIKNHFCMIYFLAWHKSKKQLLLLVLSADPWQAKIEFQINKVNTTQLKFPPQSLDQLKQVQLLASKPEQMDKGNKLKLGLKSLSLVFQFEKDLWAVSLKNANSVQPILDSDSQRMKQSYIVRRHHDKSHVYCLVEQGTRDVIVRIQLDGDDIRVETIFESSNAKLLALQADPEDSTRLFVVCDQQSVTIISDSAKHNDRVTDGVVVDVIDIASHNLDVAFQWLEHKPWKSVVISERVISIRQHLYSMDSILNWHADNVRKKCNLSSEFQLDGTLCSFQKWDVPDKSGIICFKPLPGSCLVDLTRPDEQGNEKKNLTKNAKKQQMPFVASDNKIIVQTQDLSLLVFDKDGYICHEDALSDAKDGSKQEIVKTSSQSKEYGRFFLIRGQVKDNEEYNDDQVGVYMLLQSQPTNPEADNSFAQSVDRFDQPENRDTSSALANTGDEFCKIMSQMTSTWLKDQVLRLCQNEIQITTNAGVARFILDKDNLDLQLRNSFISFKGELTVIASAEIDFKKDVALGNSMTNETILDNQLRGKSVFGLITVRGIRVVIVPCKEEKLKQLRDSLQRQGNCDVKEQKNNKMLQYRLSQSHIKSQRRLSIWDVANAQITNVKQTPSFVFGQVGSNLVWLNESEQRVYHINLDKAFSNKQGKANQCETIDCKGFSVKQINTCTEWNDNQLRGDKGFFSIDEIPRSSVLMKKKGRHFCKNKEMEEASNLMQLTCGDVILVYNLLAEQREEVSMIQDVQGFKDPITFQHTGFVYNTQKRALETSLDSSMGVQRPWPSKTGRALYRALSEIDLYQIQHVQKVIKPSDTQTKVFMNRLEFSSLLRPYKDETFFTLFPQTLVYEHIHQSLKHKIRKKSLQDASEKYDTSVRSLTHVLNRPTPVFLFNPPKKDNDQKNNREKSSQRQLLKSPDVDEYIPPDPICDLSILKQCLRFEQKTASNATIRIYKIAEDLQLNLSDFIDCMEDLEVMIDLLPTQQYNPLLSRLEENLFTVGQKSAMMDQKGSKSKIRTFEQHSSSIGTSELVDEYGHDQVEREVTVTMIPLEQIMPFVEGKDIFIFLRERFKKLQGSLLLDAIFSHQWPYQKELIRTYIFAPFLTYAFLATLYYTQCMFSTSMPMGIWVRLCEGDMQECLPYQYTGIILRVILGVLIFWQAMIEFYQMKNEEWKKYIKQWTNRLDWLSIIFNSTALVSHALDLSSLTLIRQLAAVGLLCIWLQAYLWFRLFERLAPYVDLINETISDIGDFITVFLELMAMFMVVFYMLQISRIEQGDILFDYNDTEQSPSFLWYALVNQVFLTMGDFSSTHLHRSSQSYVGEEREYIFTENILVYMVFLGSVFIGQIVVFNMLIAIMSTTYSHHCNSLDENGKNQKLKLVSEYSSLVNVMQAICCCRRRRDGGQIGAKSGLLFVITPRVEEEGIDGDNDGRGSGGKDQANVRLMRKALDEKFKQIDNFLSRKVMKSLVDMSHDTSSRLDMIEKSSYDSQESIKRDAVQKFANMKDFVKEQITSNSSDSKKEVGDKVDQLTTLVEKMMTTTQETLKDNKESFNKIIMAVKNDMIDFQNQVRTDQTIQKIEYQKVERSIHEIKQAIAGKNIK